jgi:hypothetical protein
MIMQLTFRVRVGLVDAWNPPWPERMPRRNSLVRSGIRWWRDNAHFCPDWDFMYITPSDPEIEACIC